MSSLLSPPPPPDPPAAAVIGAEVVGWTSGEDPIEGVGGIGVGPDDGGIGDIENEAVEVDDGFSGIVTLTVLIPEDVVLAVLTNGVVEMCFEVVLFKFVVIFEVAFNNTCPTFWLVDDKTCPKRLSFPIVGVCMYVCM